MSLTTLRSKDIFQSNIYDNIANPRQHSDVLAHVVLFSLSFLSAVVPISLPLLILIYI